MVRHLPSAWASAPGAGAAPGLAELAQHAVLDPLRAPPVDRRDGVAAEQHREVQVVAAGEAGGAAAAERLPLLHRSARP